MPIVYQIQIRRRERPGRRWEWLAEAAIDPDTPLELPASEASESDDFSFRLQPPNEANPRVRLFVGNALVASSNSSDRVASIDSDYESERDYPPLIYKGKLLADWVGLTELAVEVQSGDSAPWMRLLSVPLAVSAGKLKAEQFDRLFAELERDSAAVLLDVHGKTQVGLREGQPLASAAPIAVLARVRETVLELTALLHRISRQPASRLRTQFYRDRALAGQAISDASLVEACRDPSMLVQRGSTIAFREHLREHSREDYRLPEHQLIADFGDYLKSQLVDLRHRIDLEIADREGRKSWRNRPTQAGGPTWWEVEDLPRIEELRRRRLEVSQLHEAVAGWAAFHFIPSGRGLLQAPQPTPLFQHDARYRRVFRAIYGHFQTYRVTLDTRELLTRARSLPVLYEWWCAVRVVKILARGLNPLNHEQPSRPIVAAKLLQNGKRFTVDFSTDQEMTFADSRGSRVRFRYQPVYLGSPQANPDVAVLDGGGMRTPDMSLEIFGRHGSRGAAPDLIAILDAKYSSMRQSAKMQEVCLKYAKIGDARTGRILSRQVWALTPAAPESAGTRDRLRNYCTVDSEAFWSANFDPANPVNGALQMRPVAPGSFDPLQALLARILGLAGVDYSEGDGGE